MSSTNRNAERREGDHYPTPDATVRLIIDRCLPKPHEQLVLEPSAGEGAFTRWLKACGFPAVVAVEPDRALAEQQFDVADAVFIETLESFVETSSAGDPLFDVIVGNPPFKLARDHIELCMGLLAPRGQLTFLLRTGLLSHSSALLSKHPPRRVHLMQGRPSFCWSHSCKACKHKWTTLVGEKAMSCRNCGGGRKQVHTSRTDSADYCVVTWERGYRGPCELLWL